MKEQLEKRKARVTKRLEEAKSPEMKVRLEERLTKINEKLIQLES